MPTNTKKALSTALKTLLAHNELDSITVKDVVNECGVNRQTFYYHFQDIYDLLEWTFISDSRESIGDFSSLSNWHTSFLNICQYALENKNIIKNSYSSFYHRPFLNFILESIFDVFKLAVENVSSDMDVGEEDKTFIARFYRDAVVGVLVGWIRDGMREEPEIMADRLDLMIAENIKISLEKFRKQ